MGKSCRVLAALWLLAAMAGISSAGAQTVGVGQGRDPQLGSAVIDLLQAPPLPAVSVSPTHRHMLLVHERGLLPLGSIAQPMLEVAELRVNPQTYGPHAPIAYHRLTQVDVATQKSIEIPLPPGVTLGYPRWSPDGLRYVFTVTREPGVELWIGEPSEHRARRLIGPVLNATTGNPCVWMPDGRRLLCRVVPRNRRSADPVLMVGRLRQPAGPLLASSTAPSRAVTTQVLEAQLVLIDALSGNRREIGFPTAYESVEPAPSGAYLLVRRVRAPYPEPASADRPDRALEIWDITGRLIRTFGADGAVPAFKAMHWQASTPATIVWVEASDDGERIVAQSAPFDARPVELFRPEHNFAGMSWLADSSSVLIRDFDPKTRTSSLWLVDTQAQPRLLERGSIDSPHSAIGMPFTHLNQYGEQVVTSNAGGIFLRSEIADGDSARYVLDRLDLRTLARTRLWESSEKAFEPVVGLLEDDGSSILTRRESVDDPPNYIVHDLEHGTQQRVTDFRHPAPSLLAARRIPLRYERRDGRELSSILYVPGSAEPAHPLPVVMWAYPREFGTETSSFVSSAPERFLDFKRAFRLFFLLRGYAVMDEVSMPIIGEAGEANDTFIEQIVDNARAALDAAAQTGLVDTSRAGIAGHSYGAFMVANLLAHSRLFGAGVAMSGAYNRTLTPFGFQTERRSLWDAPELYLSMSPFLYSNQIEAPLLLVHGLRDDNAGTQPIQSQQFYNAIRYNGGRAELLLLPFEGHNYRARESVLQTAEAMLDWFNRYLKADDTSTMRESQLANSMTPSRSQ